MKVLKSKHSAMHWVGELFVTLMNTDSLLTYSYLSKEAKISRREISGLKQGRDMNTHFYVDAVACMMEAENLEIDEEELLRLLKKAIRNRSNVVLSLPRRTNGEGEDEGEDSGVVMRWK